MLQQVGLGVAVDYALGQDLHWIWERNCKLAAKLRAGLRAIPGVTVTDKGKTLCAIVGFIKVGSVTRKAAFECDSQAAENAL